MYFLDTFSLNDQFKMIQGTIQFSEHPIMFFQMILIVISVPKQLILLGGQILPNSYHHHCSVQ